MSIADELQSLTPSARLEFFVIDATSVGGEVMRFHAGTNRLRAPVTWQGEIYYDAPIAASGFELRGDGPRPRPTLQLGDAFGLVGAVVRAHEDLQGATLTRKRTHARYLDAVNFPGGVNPTADPTSAYEDEVWKFDRLRSRDGTQVTWELASPLDLEDVSVPARQVRNTLCTSTYRSAECGYAGGPKATVDDVPTLSPFYDECSRRTTGCQLRFGVNGDLPIGIFPGAGVLRQM